jgi:hypothetical protein
MLQILPLGEKFTILDAFYLKAWVLSDKIIFLLSETSFPANMHKIVR